MTLTPHTSFALVLAGVLAAAPAAGAPASLAGHWVGTAGARQEFALHAHIFVENGVMMGTIDIPATGGRGIPLTVKASGDSVHLEFARTLVLDGRMAADSMVGVATFVGRPGRFRLRRSAAPTLPYREEEVVFRNGAVTLSGTLMMPQSPGPRPAVVLLDGSGAALRFQNAFFADHLARLGIAALIFDKRGAGRSTGDWMAADLDDLAGDGVAGVELLKARPEVDARRIGVMGGSDAGWVLPLTASRSSDISFVISLAASTTSMAEDGAARLRLGLHALGAPDSDVALAVGLFKQDNEVTRTGKGMAELQARAAGAAREPWFRLMGFKARPVDDPSRLWARRVIDVDPMVSTQKLKIPSLWIYGGADRNTPTSENVARLERLKKSGRDITIRVLAGADQALWVQDPTNRAAWPRLAPECAEAIDGWLRRQGLSGTKGAAQQPAEPTAQPQPH